MINKLKSYFLLMRFHKPIGTLLLLWPTLWALWLAAHGVPDIRVLCVFIAGVILMRAAGCIVNDFADRHIDGFVQRTQQRPLITKAVSLHEAIVLFALLCASAFALVLLLNPLTIKLSFVALALAVIYPFTKRYTHWPQFVLGLAFAWSIPMAYAAQLGHIQTPAWILFASAVVWTLIYDTQYAMVDRDDDLKIGVKSTAILFGANVIWIIHLLQLCMLSLLIVLGWVLHLSVSYYAGIIAVAFLFLYQQRLMRAGNREQWFKAFLLNNWVGAGLFLGIVAALL